MIKDLTKNNSWIKKAFAVSFLAMILLSNTYIAKSVSVEFMPLERNAPWKEALDPNKTETLFQQIFNTMLAAAATLAVLMIMYGGVRYMTTDAWTGKEEAKGIITNAVQGLILALVAWLILFIINPDILSLRI